MSSKLKKVVGIIKDQTSISLALVSLRGSSSTLEIAILKATSHEENSVNDCYATEVLLLASSSPSAASAAAIALRRRITRTSNWVVALKTLTIIYSSIIDAGPDFRREAAMCGLLDLSSFRSSPWDFTAFVRTYALYLDARLQSSIQGYTSVRRRRRRNPPSLKPSILLDRIQHWQKLLDRAVGTRPTGPAKEHHLVQISLASVVHDSFDLYDDVAGGISVLLNNFVQLPYTTCVAIVEVCRTAAKLFEDLNEFYTVCKKMEIGRASEYPTVQKISKKLLEKLNQFLKDHQNAGNLTLDSAGSPLLLGSSAEPFLDMESPMVINRRSCSRLNRLLHDEAPRSESMRVESRVQRDLPSLRTASAREEDMGLRSSSFDKSAWIQNKLAEDAREQLIREQNLWVQHQDRIIERNLDFQS